MARGPRMCDQLRARIVQWRKDGLPIAEIASLSGYKERSIYKILALHRETGSITTLDTLKPRGRPRALSWQDITYITSIIDANPSLYLDEIQDRLATARGVEVSLATLSRSLHRVALSHKSVTKEAAERDELLRATWQAEYGDIPMEYFVWLDESSVDDRTNQRKKGWSALGRPCVRRMTFIRGQRYSVLPALSVDGLIALDIFEGSVNKDRFINFVKKDLARQLPLDCSAPLLTPYPGPRSVVVMDNCAIHHDAEIREIVVGECGAKLIYLPPYSPDFNPIEQAFHSVKAWLRRHEDRAINPESRPWLIHQAALAVTPEDARGFIVNCGYS